MMEKLGSTYDDQYSVGYSSDREGSGDLKGEHSRSQNTADGIDPEQEFVLGHSGHQGCTESRQTITQHNESRQALSRHGNQHTERRHAENQQSMTSYSGTLSYKSYPVIDMRKDHRIGTPQLHKMKVKSTHKNDLKCEVGRMFNVSNDMIHIIEEKGQKEEVLLKTIIVILPYNTGEECCHLMIEWFESVDKTHPQILCARLPVLWKMTDVKKFLQEELCWEGFVLCRNGCVLEDSMDLTSCDFRKLEKIQAVRQSYHKIEFIYRPRFNILSTYCLDVDMNLSVKQLKKLFDMHFHDEIQKQKSCEESRIQFCFKDRLLDDKECICLVLHKNIKDDKVSIHFGSENSISIYLKFRMGRKTKHKLLIVPKQISTACLRAEVSKHLHVDPKAVKLTIENKLLDEHDDLSQVHKGKWCSGCRIVADIKKCKTLRIKHPSECEEVLFEMYILEPVSVLKSKIAERWGMDFLQISLSCKGIQMENQQPLQNYAIKNNMEISLSLFEHRIILKVVILKGKKKISLVIDNSFSTAVDDVLRFCAHHFSYALECSRCIFKDHCLNRKCTLAEEGISSGDTVIISYFHQPYLLRESLINVFFVHEDGHMVQRLGAVSSGLNRNHTLAEEGVSSGDTAIITYFEQPNFLQESLTNVFKVQEDGHMIKGLGAVNSGRLLHEQ